VTRARQLIEALSDDKAFAIGKAMSIYEIKSSSFVDYSSQASGWNAVATFARISIQELAEFTAKIARGESFEGVEGLWELTKNKQLWALTDYANAGENEQYVVSYFYGGDDRREAWERAVGKDYEKMAKSLASIIPMSRVAGRIIWFNYPTGEWNSDYGWDINDVIDALIAHGWPIEDRRKQGTLIIGGTYKSEVSRLLDQ
jgi:hypothetical protein